MNPYLDQRLEAIKSKLHAGKRLDGQDALLLYQSHDLLGVGRLAQEVREQRHANKAFFIYNQHINYTNLCSNRCRFCAFARDDHDQGQFTLSIDDIKAQVLERIDEPIQEIHIVGGLNPKLPFDYYLEMLRLLRQLRPQATIKAFTAVEIDYFAQISGLALAETIDALKQAGLGMIPGGGAEVMSPRIQQALFPRKIGAERWLEVMAAIHRAGLTSNATMLYGHIETLQERVRHLLQLRELQDATGGFTAFIPLAFHSQNTELDHLPATTAFDDLKTIAVARLVLDNFDHIKAYWVMIGEKLAQVALSFGADDLDGTVLEEKITHMAGAKTAKGLTRNELEHLIRSAGFRPVERDSHYQPVQA